jgi:hypothetical protein
VDCETVIKSSNKYRNGQDHIAAFIVDCIMKTDNETDTIGKRGLKIQFDDWFKREQGNKKMPKMPELYEAMDKKFGKHQNTDKLWVGVSFIKPEQTQDEMGVINKT